MLLLSIISSQKSSAVEQAVLLSPPLPIRVENGCTTIMTALPMTTPRKAVSSIQKSYCRPKPRQRGKTDRPCGQRWSLPRKPRTAALLAS